MSTPDLYEILSALREAMSAGLRVSLPGRVTAVKAEQGRVTVRPELRVARPARDQRVEYQTLPEILDVPVCWPGTALVELTLEVRVGDPGILHFADHHMGAWLSAGAVVDPVLPDAHGPGGAFFVPGLFPQDERPALPQAPLRVRMGLRDGGARVEVADGEVRALAGGSAEAIALHAELQALRNYIATELTLPVVGATAGPIAAPVPPVSTGTTVLKGE